MDLNALQATLEQASLASLGLGFAAGFLFSFNPVALAAFPVALADRKSTRLNSSHQ